MCFFARPADAEFQLFEDVLQQLLKERNYETYVAMQNIDPGNFAFCTKICSKIITSHFCVILLNNSRHAENQEIKIPNPNVHLEYGMMLSFHKHIIPMQHESESLAFNIYPIDTVKYRNDNFKDKAESAIDDVILRVKTGEPPGRPIGPASDVLKYMSFRGLRFSDIESDDMTRTVFNLGAIHGFNLFDGPEEIVFFGYFHQEEPREIAVRVKFLLNNIILGYKRSQEQKDESFQELGRKFLGMVRIEVLIPEEANGDKMATKIDKFQPEIRKIPVAIRKPTDIEQEVRSQYEQIGL
jgi:hypothetical protein